MKTVFLFIALCFTGTFLHAQKTPNPKVVYAGLWQSQENHMAILYTNGNLEITKAGILLCKANWAPEGRDKIKVTNINLRVKAKQPVPESLFLDILSPKKIKLEIDNKIMVFLKMK
jgi:hypothetical protein